VEAIVARHAVLDEERELVARHAAGDRSAFDEIYSRYSGLVFHLALRLLGSREEALDIAQDVFLRIHRHLAGFRGASSLRTWIYRITLNQCRNQGKRFRPVSVPVGDGEDERPIADPAAGPEELAMRHEFTERVKRALGSVPDEFREALVLRDLEDLSYEEIAGVLGVPLGTVRSRIARGRERLRCLLQTAGEVHA
jgi:RNA polymerase sigma-70 factor (ECF subfamily)